MIILDPHIQSKCLYKQKLTFKIFWGVLSHFHIKELQLLGVQSKSGHLKREFLFHSPSMFCQNGIIYVFC